ncbi:MAG: hypothetical protein IJ460_00125 [Clostridia bacterium]|nr:hypothetical protein [Clostridia bacterium]
MAKCFLAFQGYDIGDIKPIPAYMDEWREKTVILRGIHAAEHMVISDYSLSVDERIEKAHRYLESGGEGPHREYFLLLSERYIKYKPIQKQLVKEIDELMEIDFKK